MTTYDSAWDMPRVNWQQQGSFEEGEIALVVEPDEGPLVCLPPINQDWLPLVMGCLDQLRNPSTWIVADDDALNAVLNKVAKLMQMFGNRAECPMCPEIRLQDCVLQFSCDAGATWTDVSGWSAGFSDCVTAISTPVVPPNPGMTPHDQHACNLAGYLAKEFIQKTMQAAYTVINSGLDQLAFAKDIATLIAYPFPLTYVAINALYDVFNYWEGQSLSEINTAANDPLLWSDVTCAIYLAIQTVGYVDATNFTAVGTALGGIAYTYSWVAPSLGNYWNELGLDNIRSLQNVGALDDVDCSGCTGGSWCYEWDFTAGTFGWTVNNGNGLWVPGLGVQVTYDSFHGTDIVNWLSPTVTTTSVTSMEVLAFACTAAGATNQRMVEGLSSGLNMLYTTAAGTIDETQSWAHAEGSLQIVFGQPHGVCTNSYLQGFRIRGTGTNPWGTSNC